jgi:hypothetical protein
MLLSHNFRADGLISIRLSLEDLFLPAPLAFRNLKSGGNDNRLNGPELLRHAPILCLNTRRTTACVHMLRKIM